jgi:D-glycero-D-manno-heptose 1,7-bisphosphate phosphatase
MLSAVFLDRDGVINVNRDDYVKSWREFRFLPGAPAAVARLSSAGVRVFVVTNQAVINRGLVSRPRIEALNARMLRELRKRGGVVEAVACCPHREDEGCACRKPRAGLIFNLARRYAIDLSASALIGDALTDIEAGQSAGCRTVLVLTGRGSSELQRAALMGKKGFLIARDLEAATELLLGSGVASAA